MRLRPWRPPHDVPLPGPFLKRDVAGARRRPDRLPDRRLAGWVGEGHRRGAQHAGGDEATGGASHGFTFVRLIFGSFLVLPTVSTANEPTVPFLVIRTVTFVPVRSARFLKSFVSD